MTPVHKNSVAGGYGGQCHIGRPDEGDAQVHGESPSVLARQRVAEANADVGCDRIELCFPPEFAQLRRLVLGASFTKRTNRWDLASAAAHSA